MEKNALINGNCVLKFDNNCQMLDSQESWSKRKLFQEGTGLLSVGMFCK